ncbi:SigB/SigF/SigG family RNA polymerase sigma factor [Streptomyces coelicoflavus]|uniref:SigB/SigF/SigG family RNA polymerase sigma factor n=1 Tax=Streptomyces coelicoflavus TaxID=285562 RepID=UPI0036BF56E2
MSTGCGRTQRRRDDTPDTAAGFERLVRLSPGPEQRALCDDLVTAWLPMAHRLARRFRDRGEPLEDLKQVAALGLVKAVNGYDPDRGTPFEPYAILTITGEIKRYFRDHSWDVHVPRRIQDMRNKVRLSIKELSHTADDRSPTVMQLVEHTGLSEEDVLVGMGALDSFRSLSLNAPAGPAAADHSLIDTLGQAESRYETIISREAVKPCLRNLPERERRILYLRFFQDMTQAQIGQELGISQMHVSRLLRQSCQQVRRHVEYAAEPHSVPPAA